MEWKIGRQIAWHIQDLGWNIRGSRKSTRERIINVKEWIKWDKSSCALNEWLNGSNFLHSGSYKNFYITSMVCVSSAFHPRVYHSFLYAMTHQWIIHWKDKRRGAQVSYSFCMDRNWLPRMLVLKPIKN